MTGYLSRRGHAATATLVSLSLLGAAPASAAADGPDLILTHGGNNPPTVLAPGSTNRWSIGVTTRAVTLRDLRLRLLAEGALAQFDASDPAARLVTVSVRSCATAWTAEACRSGEKTVIPATTLSALGGTTSLANPDGGIPAGVELLLEVALSPSAGNSAQGLSATITARVDAAGEPVSALDIPAAGLPDTGFRLGIFALLGLGAVLVGAVASRFAGARAVATADRIVPARDPGGDRC
ncbi:hypothetical protein [Arthrobacter bambusae]|uniref:hypothetical protein n=1 Tax=Arthrobacter bambusae TaxID=1338426 RepID=UPI002788CE8D|nr:hypothetical protein [Arthrobacter bambusae]MDQ0032151.1 hypothetical protein [Arthrobacter bambusae]MDQ0097757.1 hypothetical protein [Arthrobacter bambusae]